MHLPITIPVVSLVDLRCVIIGIESQGTIKGSERLVIALELREHEPLVTVDGGDVGTEADSLAKGSERLIIALEFSECIPHVVVGRGIARIKYFHRHGRRAS